MLNRRNFVMLAGAVSSLPLLGRAAFADIVPLSPEITAFGGTVEAMGPSPKPLRLAMLSFQGTTFWEVTDIGIKAATAYLAPLGTTVDYVQLGTNLTTEVIVAGLDSALTKNYDGIALCPIFDGTVSKINEIRRENVPVISFIADSEERSNRTVGMGMLAYEAGEVAGDFIVKQLDGKGKIAVITGYLGAAQHNARVKGTLERIKTKTSEITVVGPFECKDDEATAYSQASDVMTSNPDLSIIYVSAGGREAVAKAVRDAGLTGKVGVVAYNDLPEMKQYLEGGEVLALIDQAPARQTFDSLVMLHNIIGFNATYPDEVVIPAPVTMGKFAKA